MPKILITGGAGFIGSHTAVALHEAGFEPIIVDDFRNSDKKSLIGIEKIIGRKPLFFEGDCADEKFLSNVFSSVGKINGIIHFAALKSVSESISDPLAYYENNLGSLLCVLRAMKKHCVKNLIFSSSATVYGEPDSLPITENFPTKEATSTYGNTKIIGEQIIADAVRSSLFPLNAISLRYFNPIGAHPSALIGEFPIGTPNNLVPYLTQAAAGKRERLTIHGNDYGTTDGTGVRDFIHVMDLTEAHVCALSHLLSENKPEKNFYDVYNVGTGKGISVLELISEFEKVNGVKVPHTFGPRRSGDISACYADASKIKSVLGWSSKRSISQALKDAWKWEKRQATF